MDAAWTIFILAFVTILAVMEAYALRKNKTTLSRYVWKASQAWPPLPFVVGAIVGFLACHFWWGGIVHFDPVK